MSKMKEEIIERLGKLKRELADLETVIKNAELFSEENEGKFNKSFGSWKGKKSAEQIIEEIRKSRKSTDRKPEL